MGMADRGPTHVYNDFSFWLELLYITYNALVHRVFHPHFNMLKKKSANDAAILQPSFGSRRMAW